MNRRENHKRISHPHPRGKKSAFARSLRQKKRSLSLASDFSDIENSPKRGDEIQKLVGEAGLAAASEAKAIGLPKVFARNNEIIREYPNGHIEIVVEGNTGRTFFRHLKPGILHARKK